MFRVLALMTLVLAATWVTAMPVVSVDCDAGQSLNRTLANINKMNNKDAPATVEVKGTCTEYVRINGFDGLTLKGLQGATLLQPSTDPGDGLAVHVLLIEASRSITIDGLAVHSGSSALAGIGIGRNSLDVRLRNVTVDGPGVYGIIVVDSSQVSLAQVTARDPGYATVGAYDLSDVHIEDCLFEHSTGAFFHAGLDIGSGHVTIQRSTIRNMQIGINITRRGIVDVQTFNSYYPLRTPSDVVIESPTRTNFYGVSVGSGSLLNLGDAKLLITTPAQPWCGNTAGVLVSDGGTLSAGGNLFVSGSQCYGVFVGNNSHASLAGSSITGSRYVGLAVVNLSTIAVGSSTPSTEVSGNWTDVFCDSKSVVSGGANIADAAKVQCANFLAGDTEPLPLPPP